MLIRFKVFPDGKAPKYATDGAAGLDLYARESCWVLPRKRMTIPCGFALELPDGYEAQVRPRSGLAKKHGVFAMFGTIDSDYRGEIGVTLVNIGDQNFVVTPGDRIAQLVIAPVVQANLMQVMELSPTVRGSNGYGSTGTR